jgi:probable phosphoglycerate mutase
MTGELWLVRHGETEWSRAGKHTGRTDLPLTVEGEAAATAMKAGLSERSFAQVLTSPLRRAHDTARLAGFPDVVVDDDLAEWDYGDYEGLTTPQIRETVPDWTVWKYGCPDGESVTAITERADRAVDLALSHMESRDVVFVGHGHFSRSVMTRWMELPISEGIRVSMAAASISVCGFEHGVRQITALGLTGHVNPCLPP